MKLPGFQLPHQLRHPGIPQRVARGAVTEINRSLCYHTASKCRVSWATQVCCAAPWQWMIRYHIQPENNPAEALRWHINPSAQLIMRSNNTWVPCTTAATLEKGRVKCVRKPQSDYSLLAPTVCFHTHSHTQIHAGTETVTVKFFTSIMRKGADRSSSLG